MLNAQEQSARSVLGNDEHFTLLSYPYHACHYVSMTATGTGTGVLATVNCQCPGDLDYPEYCDMEGVVKKVFQVKGLNKSVIF